MTNESSSSRTKVEPVKDHPLWDKMISEWGSPVVARDQVSRFTGGIISGRSVANLDARGEGPSERVILGSRRVGYPVESLVKWLKERCTVGNVVVLGRGGADGSP